MSFLLAKILFLLLLAALLGALLMRWWLRRHYEDVTVEYIGLREDWARWRKGLDEKLARPPLDLEPLAGRLATLEGAVRAIDIPRPAPTDLGPVLAAVSAIRMPEVPRVDLGPLADRLGALEQRVAGLRMPEPTPVTDLSPVTQRLADLDKRMGAIVIPSPREPDLAPLSAKLAELDRAVRAIVIPAPKDPDLSSVVSRIGAVENKLGALRMPDPAPAVNLAPLQAKLDAVERTVGAIRVPAAPDLSAIDNRLAGMERKLAEVAQARPTAVPPVDLTPLQQRLDALERAVRGIAIPAPKDCAL